MNEVDFSDLPKKERKKIKREMERTSQEKSETTKKLIIWVIGLLVIGLFGIVGWFGYKELNKPLPGQKVEDLGRGHISREEWEKQVYNSNPPTSGSHDEQWVKAGVFSTPQLEGQLIHSLEHGYIVLSYNCGLEQVSEASLLQKQNVEQVDKATESAQASSSATSAVNALSAGECDELKKQLSDLANDKRLWKLIVVPRPQLDARIAVTAWTWIDKLNEFDKDRLVAFIDAHRNHGPEQTME